jgi:peptide/nickel transport system substrate-binding protein
MDSRYIDRDPRGGAMRAGTKTRVGAAIAVATIWSGALVPAALSQETTGSTQDEKVTFTVGQVNDAITFNPMFAIETPEYNTMDAAYDTFLTWELDGMETAPGLAESWEQSEDGLTWTFKVKEGVTWSDGTPFTAHDVAATYNWILDEEVGNYIDYLPFTDSITAPDDTTLVWTTTRPTGAPLYPPFIYVMPEHVLSQYEDKADFRTWKGFPDTIGTGPFELVEWRRGDFWRMEANPDYWLGAPQIDELVFRVFQNDEALIQALEQGEVDFAYDIQSPDLFDSLQGNPEITAQVSAPQYFVQMSFNQCTNDVAYCKKTGFNRHPALVDPQLRLAVEYAIDRQTLVDRVKRGYATVGTTVVNQPRWHVEPENPIPYDPEEATRILDEAGYLDSDGDGVREMPGGGEPLDFRFIVRTENPGTVEAGQFITEWLADVGISTQPEAVNDSKLTDIWYSNDYDLYIWGWGIEPDPNFQLSTYQENQCGVWSDTCYANPEYDQLFKDQQAAPTVEEREAIVAEMQQIVYDDRPEIVLWLENTLEAYRNEWTGFQEQLGPGQETGELFFQYGKYSVLTVQPASASSGTADDGGGIPAAVWVIGGIAVLVVAGVAVVASRRRRAEEDEI